MHAPLRIVALVALTLSSACRATPRDDSPAPLAQSHAPAGEAVRWSGAVSESEFKAMHQLRQDAPPKLMGTLVEIAGSRAYLSLPPNAKGPLPAITVIHEWWGLNDHIKHWADRLAADGYAALAVDLYGGFVATSPDEAMNAMKSVDRARATEILLAAHRFLAEDPRIEAQRRGCIGWCFGGHQSLRLAIAARDLDAAVMYYGQPIMDEEELASLRAPLLGIFGTRDQSIPPPAVNALDELLTKLGREHEFYSFDAEHAFANPSNPQYDEDSAAQAWKIAREFLEQHLKTEP